MHINGHHSYFEAPSHSRHIWVTPKSFHGLLNSRPISVFSLRTRGGRQQQKPAAGAGPRGSPLLCQACCGPLRPPSLRPSRGRVYNAQCTAGFRPLPGYVALTFTPKHLSHRLLAKKGTSSTSAAEKQTVQLVLKIQIHIKT